MPNSSPYVVYRGRAYMVSVVAAVGASPTMGGGRGPEARAFLNCRARLCLWKAFLALTGRAALTGGGVPTLMLSSKVSPSMRGKGPPPMMLQGTKGEGQQIRRKGGGSAAMGGAQGPSPGEAAGKGKIGPGSLNLQALAVGTHDGVDVRM
jgi:hypothetical protein